MKITWLGHSTVLFETASGRLLTDPVLRDRFIHLRRHSASVRPLEPVDAVLISHLHHDHVDRASLRTIDAPVFGPRGIRRTLGSLPHVVRELAPGDAIELAGTEVTVVQAVHDGRRWPVGERRDDDAIGFVIAADGQRAYFAGDTELYDGMSTLGRLDVALVPIWGWGTRLGPGHMDPEQAAEAVALLRPAVVIPIHYGTFLPVGAYRRHRHLLHEPAERFAECTAELAPDVRVELIAPGGSFTPPG